MSDTQNGLVAEPGDRVRREEQAAAESTGGSRGGVPLLECVDINQEFVVRGHGGVRSGVLRAVADVSFSMRTGETLGIVGESGSGKSTLARAILFEPPAKSGRVIFRGTDLGAAKKSERHEQLRHMQIVFQDPFSSVNPKWTAAHIVAEPLRAFKVGTGSARQKRVNELLDLVGLDPSVFAKRHPRALSGGQCQRVAIARALALSPELIICDEAVSSLDVLVQAQILNLFEELHRELGLAYLFIAHDLALVKQVSDRVAVMYLGQLCEIGPAEAVLSHPQHPYTSALLQAIPGRTKGRGPGRVRVRVAGEPPSPLDPPSGCRFRTRCPRAQERCAVEEPKLQGGDHVVACHFPLGTGTASAKPTATV